MLLENTLPIDGRYIQIVAKVPVFEHFLTLHHATFHCTSYILEHFCVWWYCLFHAASSHILHFSCAFKHFPAASVPESHQRAGKAPTFEHPSNTTRLHKPPQLVARSLTLNTFCSVASLSDFHPVSHSALLGWFWTLPAGDCSRSPQDISREQKKVPVFEHLPL